MPCSSREEEIFLTVQSNTSQRQPRAATVGQGRLEHLSDTSEGPHAPQKGKTQTNPTASFAAGEIFKKRHSQQG